MTQTITTYAVSDPSGLPGLTIEVTARIEDYSDEMIAKSHLDAEDRYAADESLRSTPWRATIESTDYVREIGWYATDDEAAAAAMQAAESDTDRITVTV